MKLRSLFVAGMLVASAALLGGQQRATATPAAVKLVDRTLSCTTGVQGGARVIYLTAQSAYGDGGRLEWLAQATVAAVGQPLPFKPNYRPTLAGMTAGWPTAPPLTGGIGFDNRLCKPARTRLPLGPRGLAGNTASQSLEEYSCVVPRTMLVRIRVSFREPVDLRLRQRAYSAGGRVVRGQIAVATAAGKPIAYAEVTESGGKSRLHKAKGCL